MPARSLGPSHKDGTIVHAWSMSNVCRMVSEAVIAVFPTIHLHSAVHENHGDREGFENDLKVSYWRY